MTYDATCDVPALREGTVDLGQTQGLLIDLGVSSRAKGPPVRIFPLPTRCDYNIYLGICVYVFLRSIIL